MTQTLCDQVAERMAMAEPLGELSDHAAACARCRGLATVSSQLAATRHAIDPGLGFSARMTVGAQHRLVVRRRRRIATGLAATVATGALGVFVVARSSQPRPPDVAASQPPRDHAPTPPDRAPQADEDADLAALVQLADVDRSAHLSARWGHIKKPLSPYKTLLKGVLP